MFLFKDQPQVSNSTMALKSGPFRFNTTFGRELCSKINDLAAHSVSLDDVATTKQLVVHSIGSTPVRNCVLSGGLYNTATSYSLLTPGYQLSVRLEATTDAPVVVTFANGVNPDHTDLDYFFVLTSELGFSNLTPNATNYLYLETDGVSVTTGSSTTKPSYGTTVNSSGLYLLQHFTNTMVDEVSGLNWIGGDAYSTQSNFGDSSRQVTSTAITSPGGVTQSPTWTLEWWWYFTRFSQLYRLFMINDDTKSMPSLSADTWGTQFRIWLSSNGVNSDLYSGYISGHSFNTLNTWRHVALQYDGQYLTLWGHGTKLFSLALSKPLFSSSNTKFTLPQQTSAWGGYVDEVSYVPDAKYSSQSSTIVVPSSPAPSPTVAFYNLHSGQFYAGPPSSLQPTIRVYVGEVQTTSNTVANIVSYSPGGYYDSGWVNINPNTSYTINHNLGTDLIRSHVTLRDSGVVIDSQTSNSLSNANRYGTTILSQNDKQIQLQTQSSAIGAIQDSSGAAKTQFFKPQARVVVYRGF